MSKSNPARGLAGGSPAMSSLSRRIERLAKSRGTVLVTGPTGSGKELVARALHDASGRTGAFLAINAGALGRDIAESELFGHVRGAFTGAVADKTGAFEAASGGTLFLDEIGELPPALQAKLLRVLETGTVRHVGGTEEIAVDTRVIAATHRDLRDMVTRGSFREDLLHRIEVLTIRVPSLDERREDVLPLARHFLALEGAEHMVLSLEAEQALLAHRFTGNVRELKNAITRAVLLAESGLIRAEDLELEATATEPPSRQPGDGPRDLEPLSSAPGARTIDEERTWILAAIEACGGNRARAARVLGLSKSTLHSRMKRLGLPLKSQSRSQSRKIKPVLELVAGGGST